MIKHINPINALRGTFTVPGDKSISHRAVMLGALAEGETHITGFLTGEDCRCTIACFRQMGVGMTESGTAVTVQGVGLRGLRPPTDVLDVGNSGTTVRLMAGILAWQNFTAVVTGDASIQKRPMNRVIAPLSQMGAVIEGRAEAGDIYAPLTITGRPLRGIQYATPVASAQVKSAILLASLQAEGETAVTEPAPSRDHTEIMLNHFGGNITRNEAQILSRPIKKLTARPVAVPGDISSAAFLIVAAAILKDSDVTIKEVNVNPTRTGVIDVLRQMGADIAIGNVREQGGEAVADVRVRHAKLRGTTIAGAIIPRLIDEIPVLAVAAAFAEGTTVVADAAELMVKESNRIATMCAELAKMGVAATPTADGMHIAGGKPPHGAAVNSYGDHRVAMSLCVAGLCAEYGETVIHNAACVDVSFPGFFELIRACSY